MFRKLQRRVGINKRSAARSGIWPISAINLKHNEELLFKLKIVFAGIAAFGLLMGPLLWIRLRSNIDLRDFEGMPLRRIRTEITDLQIRPLGKWTVVGRPWILVRVEGRNLVAGGISQDVYSQARIGLPVEMEYRRARNGRLHVFRTEKWRPLEPGMVRGR